MSRLNFTAFRSLRAHIEWTFLILLHCLGQKFKRVYGETDPEIVNAAASVRKVYTSAIGSIAIAFDIVTNCKY